MKKFIILASLGIAVFSFAPYHTVAVPISPTQAPKALKSTDPLGGLPPPPPILILPPPPPPLIILPPPPPIVIVLPPPPPNPVPVPPPPPPAPTTGVPETGGTWLLLLLGLAGTFGILLIQQQSKKSSHRDS